MSVQNNLRFFFVVALGGTYLKQLEEDIGKRADIC